MLEFKKHDLNETTPEIATVKTVENKTEGSEVLGAENSRAENQNSSESWKGDNKYFQTGKKAGQLKPKFKTVSENDTKKETQKETKKTSSIDDELESLKGAYSTPVDNQKTIIVDKTTQVDEKKLAYINGYMLLTFSDFLFPMLISFMFKKKMKEKNMTAKDLKMTREERDNIKELADQCAKELSLNMSPTQAYLLGSGIIYFSKMQ